MRVFIGIAFDSVVKDYLKNVQDAVKPTIVKGDLTTYDNFHLTLKYLGNVTDSELESIYDICDYVARNQKPFTIKINGLDSFVRKTSSILWVGVKDGKEQLKKLFNLIEEETIREGFEEEGRKYRPHITIGKKVVFSSYQHTEMIPYLEDKVPVRYLTLFESHRVNEELVYTPIYEVELTG